MSYQLMVPCHESLLLSRLLHLMLLHIAMIAHYKLTRPAAQPRTIVSLQNKFDGAPDPFPLEVRPRWSFFCLFSLANDALARAGNARSV